MLQILYSLPLWTAKIAAMIIFSGILIIAWMLPYDFVMEGAPNEKRWRDLRIWATLLTAVQIIIYYIFQVTQFSFFSDCRDFTISLEIELFTPRSHLRKSKRIIASCFYNFHFILANISRSRVTHPNIAILLDYSEGAERLKNLSFHISFHI